MAMNSEASARIHGRIANRRRLLEEEEENGRCGEHEGENADASRQGKRKIDDEEKAPATTTTWWLATDARSPRPRVARLCIANAPAPRYPRLQLPS